MILTIIVRITDNHVSACIAYLEFKEWGHEAEGLGMTVRRDANWMVMETERME